MPVIVAFVTGCGAFVHASRSTGCYVEGRKDALPEHEEETMRDVRSCRSVFIGFVMAVLMLPAVKAPAEQLQVRPMISQVGAAWYQDGSWKTYHTNSPAVGWRAGGKRYVTFAAFDLSFLPPGSTISSAVLKMYVFRVVGDPVSYGKLSAGVLDLESCNHVEPVPEWAVAGRIGTVELEDPIEKSKVLTIDVTTGVVDRVLEHPDADPGRVVVRLEFPAGGGEANADDYVGLGSLFLQLDVQLPDPITARPIHRHMVRCLPVVASNPGAQGTRWVTELQVSNTNTGTAGVWLYFTPTETDGTTGFSVRRVNLSAYRSVRYEDVLPELFGLNGTKGWLEVFSTNPDILVSARVANVGGTGSYGQAVPLVNERNAVTRAGARYFDSNLRFLNLGAVDASNRTNVGFVNLAESAAEVSLWAWWGSGRGADTTVTIPAFGHVQLNRLEQLIPGIKDAGPFFLQLVMPSGHGKVVAYLTRVDNTTGDAVFLVSE